MNSNIFLKLFGLNPDDFEFTYDGPIDCDDGYIYIVLNNTSDASYVINGLSYDNHLE